MTKKYDCIVVGGGAAGLMCASAAANRGRNTLVLDHANKVGKKILMSGGGRCNFTNYFVESNNYISGNPHFCKSALSRYSPYDFIELVEEYKVPFHEKTQGQLFCNNKSSDILQILLSECEKAGAEIKTACKIEHIEKVDTFRLHTSLGEYSCQSLVIATGGLSIPTMGATGFGYEVAQQFGLSVTTRQPALVPFTFSDKWRSICDNLSGVSMGVEITTNDRTFRDALLFTHRGISGPAVLQITNYWHLGDEVRVNFFPHISLESEMRQSRDEGSRQGLKTLLSKIPGKTPAKKFLETWLSLANLHGPQSKPIAEISNDEIDAIANQLHCWRFTPAGTEGYRTAEVTKGGVDTDEVSSKTFECKKIQGLYFIGEVLDVTGWLGGFNFQWAWASGWCAGQYV